MAESDLTFEPECEVLYEGGPDCTELFTMCEKNPGHKGLIPVRNLSVNDLPKRYSNVDSMSSIKYFTERTVKVSVRYTSADRPSLCPYTKKKYPYSNLKGNSSATRCGTGFVYFRFDDNKRGGDFELHVTTAAHVIFDDSEAKEAVIEFFYDSEDKEGVKYAYGVSVKHKSITDDVSVVKCVTRDKTILERLQQSSLQSLRKLSSVMVSHPHGLRKHISFGNSLKYTYPTAANDGSDLNSLEKISSGICNEYRYFSFDKQNNMKIKKDSKYDSNLPCYVLKIPEDSASICHVDVSSLSTSFPLGSTMTTPDGKVFDVGSPHGLKVEREWDYFDKGGHPAKRPYLSHSFLTCPGSSGARLCEPSDWTAWLEEYDMVHAGSLSNNIGRSGFLNAHIRLTFAVIFPDGPKSLIGPF